MISILLPHFSNVLEILFWPQKSTTFFHCILSDIVISFVGMQIIIQIIYSYRYWGLILPEFIHYGYGLGPTFLCHIYHPHCYHQIDFLFLKKHLSSPKISFSFQNFKIFHDSNFRILSTSLHDLTQIEKWESYQKSWVES